MKKITFAVAGFGHIGRRHATILHGHPDCELLAIAEPDAAAAAHSLYPAGVAHYSSLTELLNASHKPEVVCIATPNGLHAPLAIEALKAGCHVVIEKPMALKKSDCEEIIFTALKQQRQVFVVKQNRYSPPSKWLKEVVDSKALGKVLMVQVNCYWNRDDRYYGGGWKGTKDLDGGVLFTQFSHFVDILYWVFGDIKSVRASMKNYTHGHSTAFEDSGLVQFEFANGGMGCINFSTSVWDTNMESSITVVGTKGSAKVGGQYMNEVEYCHIENYTLPELPPTNPPNDYGPFKGSAANHHYVFENVVNTLRGTDTITANALEGMKVVEMIERMYEAAGK